MPLNRTPLSKENLLRHNEEHSLETPEHIIQDLSDPDQEFQNVRLNTLFVQTDGLNIEEESESSESASNEEDLWVQERGRRLSIEKGPRNTQRSPNFPMRATRRGFNRSRPESLQDSTSSFEEKIDTSMLLNAKVTGRDENGISNIFDTDNTSILVSKQQPTDFIDIALRPDSQSKNPEYLRGQNSDNEKDPYKEVPALVLNKKRRPIPVPEIPAVSRLKRARSASPRIPSGRQFKIPRLHNAATSDRSDNNDSSSSTSFDLKFPRFQ